MLSSQPVLYIWQWLALSDPIAPWATLVALLGLVISGVVALYSARLSRKTSKESNEIASWSAMVEALQQELNRLHSRVSELEKNEKED